MTFRTTRERIVQTLAYEVGGLLLATPAYAFAFGTETRDSALLIAALSVAVLVWAPLHNAAFDRIDWNMTGRLASDRRPRGRLVHALSLEVSVLLLTCPLVILLGGYTLPQALLVNLGLTLFYMVYAYVFHLGYDRLRPVAPRPAAGKTSSNGHRRVRQAP